MINKTNTSELMEIACNKAELQLGKRYPNDELYELDPDDEGSGYILKEEYQDEFNELYDRYMTELERFSLVNLLISSHNSILSGGDTRRAIHYGTIAINGKKIDQNTIVTDEDWLEKDGNKYLFVQNGKHKFLIKKEK